MVEIKLKTGQSGYDVIGEYIHRFWDHHITDTVVVSMEISYDGNEYERSNEVASPCCFDDIEFLYDWWEGEKFIKLFGITLINDLDISGGIYTE